MNNMKRKKKTFIKRSLFLKWFFICLSIILIITTILGVVMSFVLVNYYKKDQYQYLSSHLDNAISFTFKKTQNAMDENIRSEISEMYGLLSMAMGENILFFDTNGNLILSQSPNEEYKLNDIELPNLILQDIETGGVYYGTRYFGGSDVIWYTVGKPLTLQNKTQGYLFVARSSDFMEIYLKNIIEAFLLSAIIAIIISCLILFSMVSKMTKPLKEVAAAAREYAKGNFFVRVDLTRDDEIGELATEFNKMGRELELIDESRKSFISDVSHELRTPMTSISGFVDGILDGTIPAEEEKKYLRIISSETKRLTKVVRSMLNLSRIEAGELNLVYTKVSFDSMVLSILLSLEDKIVQKNIEIIGLENAAVDLYVDKDLVFQVFYNIIENAVKFVNEGGKIEFEFFDDPKNTEIVIRNTGETLNEEECENIFKRFYKVDKSRGLDQTGVGLGLNIVLKIINLHNGTIKASSKMGEYTEFRVVFPKKKNL